jgi:hypothetical protein
MAAACAADGLENNTFPFLLISVFPQQFGQFYHLHPLLIPQYSPQSCTNINTSSLIHSTQV